MKKFKFILYISGHSPASALAQVNLRGICNEYLKDRHELNVIDIEEFPELAEEAGIMAIPTLVKLEPYPVKKFIGSMSDKKKVIEGLGIIS